MPLVDRLRAHLRKRIPAEDVKLVSPLSGSNQLYWRAAQPASHCDAAGVLADRTEVALRYAGTFENDLVEVPGRAEFHGGAIPKVEYGRASRVRGPYGHLQPVSRRDEHHICRAALTRHRDR